MQGFERFLSFCIRALEGFRRDSGASGLKSWD